MAGIYSQGGSAGHRYAGWLSKVEAKNFQFGGKVFNGSPSAIYVGSKMVWPSGWLTFAAVKAIVGAFGQKDGAAVIAATNEYLNGIAASDKAKATALAGFINEVDYMVVTSLPMSEYLPSEFVMPIRYHNAVGGWTGIDEWAKGADLDMEATLIKKNTETWINIFYQGSNVGVNTHCFSVVYGDTNSSLIASIAGIGRIVSNYQVSNNTLYRMRMKNGEGFWLNGNKLATTSAISAAIAGPMVIGTCGDIFSKVTVKDTTNAIDWYLIPAIGSNGKSCLLDAKSGQVIALSTSTYTETYLKNGQPWTPPTP